MCGIFWWWFFNAVRGSIFNLACGFNPPPSNVADRAFFGVCRPNLVGPNGRRAGFNLRVDSNGYKKSSIGTSGQRHILPLSDRTSRPHWHPRVLERL